MGSSSLQGLPWDRCFSWDGESEQLEREDVMEARAVDGGSHRESLGT